jgi:hypothetical protein
VSDDAQRLTGRLAAELPPRIATWLDPALDELRSGLSARARFVDDPADAATWVLRARRIDVDGTIEQLDGSPVPSSVLAGPGAPRADAAKRRVIALSLLGASPPDRIVASCRGLLRADLVLCEEAVLEVADEGLVIVELARGVSARDLQARVEPTLLVSPGVKEMLAAPPPAIVE